MILINSIMKTDKQNNKPRGAKMKNYTIEEQNEIGQKIAAILMLKKNRQTKRYQTTWGDRTAIGIFNTVLRLAEMINNNEEITKG